MGFAVHLSKLALIEVGDPGSNPVSQAGGKALSPVREEREEEDPRLRLKSLE